MRKIRLTESALRKLILEKTLELLSEAKLSVLRKYNQDINDDIFYRLVNADPTYNPNNKDKSGKYTKWLLSLYHKDNSILERLNAISEDLKTYNPNLQPDRATIESIADDKELRQRIESLKGNTQDRNKKEEFNKDIVFDSPEWMIITPSTHSSSMYWGQGTNWCTASQNPDYFNDYCDGYNKLYINIDKRNNAKYQFHSESEEYNDSKNNPINKKGESLSEAADKINMPVNVRIWYGENTLIKKFLPVELIPQVIKAPTAIRLFFAYFEPMGLPHLFKITTNNIWNVLDVNQHKYWFPTDVTTRRDIEPLHNNMCKITDKATNTCYFLNQYGERINDEEYLRAENTDKICKVTFKNRQDNILLPDGSYMFDTNASLIMIKDKITIADFDEPQKKTIVLDNNTHNVIYQTQTPNEHVMNIEVDKKLFPTVKSIGSDIVAVTIDNTINCGALITLDGRLFSIDFTNLRQLDNVLQGKDLTKN